MTQPFKWYAGPDAENYPLGPFDSREQAIREGGGEYEGNYFIIEARKDEVDWRVIDEDFVDDIIESIGDRNSHNGGEDGFEVGSTRQQQRDLIERLNTTIEMWANMNGINPFVWSFAETRNKDEIEVDVDE